jgi:hypothetical protein
MLHLWSVCGADLMGHALATGVLFVIIFCDLEIGDILRNCGGRACHTSWAQVAESAQIYRHSVQGFHYHNTGHEASDILDAVGPP